MNELKLCGGTASKVVEAVVYDVIGGAGRRVMSSMGCRVLVPAEDLDQARGRYYGRIISKDRRVLRFFIQVDGKNMQEVCRQSVTEPFIACQCRGYLVSWQDLTCHGGRVFLTTVSKGPIDTDYVQVIQGLQKSSGLPVLRVRANERRFGRATRSSAKLLPSVERTAPIEKTGRELSTVVTRATSGLGSDVCGLLGRVGYMCRRVGNAGHMLILRELIVSLVGEGDEPGWVEEASLDFPVRVQLQGEGEGGAVAALRAFRAGVEHLASIYTLDDVRVLVESCGDERIHGGTLD